MIILAETDAQILATLPVMRQLRPHVPPEAYLSTVRRMMRTDGYRLAAALDDDVVVAVAGYRRMETLYAGPVLYVDDLVTDERARSAGWGGRLLAWLREQARAEGCAALHLDSGVQRADAHRFYFREGMAVRSFHFSAPL